MNSAFNFSALRILLVCASLLAATPSTAQIVGPMVGQVNATEARLLYRPGAVARDLRIDILNAQGAVAATASATVMSPTSSEGFCSTR